MDELEAYEQIRAACYRRPDLRFSNWEPGMAHHELAPMLGIGFNGLVGYCFIATEVFCALTGATPWCAHEGMHFWAQVGDTVWDPTEDQFSKPFSYENGRPTQLDRMSPRARALLDEVLAGMHGSPWQTERL